MGAKRAGPSGSWVLAKTTKGKSRPVSLPIPVQNPPTPNQPHPLSPWEPSRRISRNGKLTDTSDHGMKTGFARLSQAPTI